MFCRGPGEREGYVFAYDDVYAYDVLSDDLFESEYGGTDGESHCVAHFDSEYGGTDGEADGDPDYGESHVVADDASDYGGTDGRTNAVAHNIFSYYTANTCCFDAVANTATHIFSNCNHPHTNSYSHTNSSFGYDAVRQPKSR